MRGFLMVGVVCIVAGLGGCGGDTPDGLAQKTMTAMDALSDALEKGDKAGAKAAARTLGDVTAKAKALNMTAEQKQAVQEKHKSQMEAAIGRMIKALGGAVSGGKFTKDELDELSKSMKQ